MEAMITICPTYFPEMLQSAEHNDADYVEDLGKKKKKALQSKDKM